MLISHSRVWGNAVALGHFAIHLRLDGTAGGPNDVERPATCASAKQKGRGPCQLMSINELLAQTREKLALLGTYGRFALSRRLLASPPCDRPRWGTISGTESCMGSVGGKYGHGSKSDTPSEYPNPH